MKTLGRKPWRPSWPSWKKHSWPAGQCLLPVESRRDSRVRRTVSEVAPGVIGKCLNGRSKMKERAFDVLLMYIEIEKHLEIEEELIKGLDNKQPKIVQACLELLRKGLS